MVKRSKSEKFKTKMNTKFHSAMKGSKSGASTNPDRKLTDKQANSGHSFMRTKQTINRM
jgi:nuclear GTP-binding protein